MPTLPALPVVLAPPQPRAFFHLAAALEAHLTNNTAHKSDKHNFFSYYELEGFKI